MRFEFRCMGHENVLALHKNTIEFTKESELTKRGDCVLGVSADFDYDKLLQFAAGNKQRRVQAEIFVGNMKDEFGFFLNPEFADKKEIVIRKSDFLSRRTLGTRADKAACDINRELVERIKDKNSEMLVIFKA